TFSSTSSATEPCRPCSWCPAHMMVAEACPPTRDTVCAPHCAPGHFLHAENGSSSRCLPCQACGLGSGVVALCRPTTNTVCQRCPEGFYSEEKSAVAPCLPCRRECSEDEVMIRGCSPGSDTLCMGMGGTFQGRGSGPESERVEEQRAREPAAPPTLDSPASPSPFTGKPTPSNVQPVVFLGTSKNIIPVYCSILAAVVVGLLAYVAFKWWPSCKQKQQLAKARAGELGASPEGEKLHSDSGVFLDTHSLQE
uniref:TNFR-Cys domain-containing protein n=1 Tax=Pelodiscus sinensis TaxID=13735 RepID=K7GGQ9_PELSI